MADSEGTDNDTTYDVFLIHANEPTEDRDFALERLKPLLKEKGLEVLTDQEFPVGHFVMHHIAKAVRRSRKSVIVLTEHSNKSAWCSLELLLALEKSHRHNTMSLVVLRIGDSVEEQVGLEMLNTVPHVDIKDYNDIDGKIDELVCEINDTKQTEELLPAGNIAHAQVWSHYYGLLQYLLPEIEILIKKTELYKKYPNRFSLKLYELVPEDCCCPGVIKDIGECEDGSRIVKMQETLPKLTYTRSGNSREVHLTIYGVGKENEEYYCVAEYPPVLSGIQKMVDELKLKECDKRVQLGRFYYTLNALLRHESLENTRNKANIIMFNDHSDLRISPHTGDLLINMLCLQKLGAQRANFALAKEMLKAIKEDLGIGALKKGQVEKPMEKLSESEPLSYEFEAFLLYDNSDETSRRITDEIAAYLETKEIKYLLEDERSGERRLNLEIPMQKCYWTIVVLTKRSLQNNEFTLTVLSLLHSYFEKKIIRFIPVLVDTMYCDIPDAIRFVTYVGVDEQKRYLERLCCTLQGKAIPFDKDSLIPAGNVGYGLAWTYVLNYLQFALKGVGDAVSEFLRVKEKSSCIHKKKIYIIVPFSCECKTTLSEADESISKLGTFPPDDEHRSDKRRYSFDMYTFMDSEKEYVFAGQYAAPVTCLNEMMKVRIAGLSEEDMVKQSRIFCHEIELTLANKFKDLLKSCEIVSYDDIKNKLSAEIKRRLTKEECNKSSREETEMEI